MTKKHFIALADVIKSVQGTENEFTPFQIGLIGGFCAANNPEFKHDRWSGYIHGINGKNGGKVKQAV